MIKKNLNQFFYLQIRLSPMSVWPEWLYYVTRLLETSAWTWQVREHFSIVLHFITIYINNIMKVICMYCIYVYIYIYKYI